MTINKRTRIIISVIMAIVIAVCLFVIGKDAYETNGSENDIREIRTIIHETTGDEDIPFTKESYIELKKQNSDFVAYIDFDNGLLSLPVLQGKDNEYYLHHTFFKKYYYLHGHPFMNCNSTIHDQNIIIYGHNNRTSENKMFSPLNKLLEQSEYGKNAYFKIYYEDSVRSYVITNIYVMDNNQYAKYNYEKTFIREDEWDDWIGFANENNRIKPIDGDIKYGNNFVTLQTCAIGNEKIVVVLAREIKVEEF